MTFAELVQEVKDRGYDYVSTGRIERAVQSAYRRICARHAWPFLEETKEGTAPLTFTDLGKILSVKDTTTGVEPIGTDRRWLVGTFTSLTETGSAVYWYLEGETLKLYPSATDTLQVRYQKRPADLEAGDTPLVPSEWQYLIVDLAVAECLRDNDEYSEARALRQDVNETIDREMVPAYRRNNQNSEIVIRTGFEGDYL